MGTLFKMLSGRGKTSLPGVCMDELGRTELEEKNIKGLVTWWPVSSVWNCLFAQGWAANRGWNRILHFWVSRKERTSLWTALTQNKVLKAYSGSGRILGKALPYYFTWLLGQRKEEGSNLWSVARIATALCTSPPPSLETQPPTCVLSPGELQVHLWVGHPSDGANVWVLKNKIK